MLLCLENKYHRKNHLPSEGLIVLASIMDDCRTDHTFSSDWLLLQKVLELIVLLFQRAVDPGLFYIDVKASHYYALLVNIFLESNYILVI